MAPSPAESTPKRRFEHLVKVMSSDRFLSMRGLGKELPFFICPFSAEDAVEMRRQQTQLVNQLNNRGLSILQLDLYDLSIELLTERGIWDEVAATEQSFTKDELKELLQGVLDPENHLVPLIGQKIASRKFDALIISGVGEVFPYIRSHNVLNNLQRVAGHLPTVMLFPGTYVHGLSTGASLDLFGRLHDDKYYRAFNIFHYEV